MNFLTHFKDISSLSRYFLLILSLMSVLALVVNSCATPEKSKTSSNREPDNMESYTCSDSHSISSNSISTSSSRWITGDPHSSSSRWITGDPHLHAHCSVYSASNESLVSMLVKNKLNVGSVLVFGLEYELDRSLFTGEDHPLSLPEYLLHYDLEVSSFAASHMGHLNILGLSDIDFSDDPFDHPRTGIPIVEWAKSQNDRVVVGMNHAQWWPDEDGVFPSTNNEYFGSSNLFEFPVHVANGTSSFLEIERDKEWDTGSPISKGAMNLWRVLQNSGFRIAITGASDFLCMTQDLSLPNIMRTYILIDREFSYKAYLDGIKAGRTVSAIGSHDWMNFTISIDNTTTTTDNSTSFVARLGDEIQVRSSESLIVSITSNFSQTETVRILVNGKSEDSFIVESGPQMQTRTLSLHKSSWITVQSSRVQSSSIYVIVDGKPIRVSADDACYLVQYMDHLMDFVSKGALKGLDKSTVEFDYQNARKIFIQRFLEAGGESCPST